MKNQALPVVGVLLGASVLLNIVLLTRAKEDPAPAPAARPRPAPASTVPAPQAPEGVYERVVPPAPGAAAAETTQAPVLETRRPSSAPRPSSIPLDPSVEAVLDAQEKFGTFWKDLDRVFKAKDRLESAKFVQTVVVATMDFLELPEHQRPLFSQAVQDGMQMMARARQDRDAARKALPPKDKNDAAGYAVYQQQKDAIDARYVAQSKAATESLAARLSPDKARHAEFISRSEPWLRNLLPKNTP